MPFRYSVAVLLFCLFTALIVAQGTPGGKTPILTGFKPFHEKDLQAGNIGLFDEIDTFGWKGDAKIKNGKLYFTGKLEETPLWFFPGISSLWEDQLKEELAGGMSESLGLAGSDDTVMHKIFDGKTLTGWTIRGKAEAEVKDEIIRLTNGSGSLESDGKYADFILQLEYFTPERPEGRGVNSGVFFRCIPGEMMNGYECQILNNAGENDYKSFIGTDTGGIFRRQVGRNVGPKDGEWNYLTIAARGARIATWVNGIQVTDWDDERSPHNNPRNGLRTEAGTIQFQGHDPSTEILFRNIRIQEL